MEQLLRSAGCTSSTKAYAPANPVLTFALAIYCAIKGFADCSNESTMSVNGDALSLPSSNFDTNSSCCMRERCDCCELDMFPFRDERGFATAKLYQPLWDIG